MPGLVPGIHVFRSSILRKQTWMAGTSPAMTSRVDTALSRPLQFRHLLAQNTHQHLPFVPTRPLGSAPGLRARPDHLAAERIGRVKIDTAGRRAEIDNDGIRPRALEQRLVE